LEMDLDSPAIKTIVVDGQPQVYRDLTHEAK
jgi:hypothetical protein